MVPVFKIHIFYIMLDYFLPRAAPLSLDPPVRLAAGFGLADEPSSSSSLPNSSSDSFAFSSTAWTTNIGKKKGCDGNQLAVNESGEEIRS